MLVEHCQKIHIKELTKLAKNEALKLFVHAKVSVLGQALKITTSDCNFGGKRFWLICPRCSNRVGTLYKRPDGDLLLCRKCHGLNYLKSRYHKMM